MDNQSSPTLTHAHQQIRLGDNQASLHKWSIAIEYYLRAIEYLKIIQNTMTDSNLLLSLQVQINQCEKLIHLCRVKDRFEQAERVSKLKRAHSTSDMICSGQPSQRILARHNTFQVENPVMIDSLDSLSNTIFFPERKKISAKKNQKQDAHKLEELQMSYDALKTHLKAAFDDIERLKNENNQLRTQQGVMKTEEQTDDDDDDDDDDDSDNYDDPGQETELEATL